MIIYRIDGHSDMVTDFAFSPFDDNLVVTGSQVKMSGWQVRRI